MNVTTRQSDERLLASKQLELIYRRHPFSFWSTLLLSGTLAAALWPIVDHAALLAWLLSLWLVMAVRDVYARKYLKLAREETVAHEKWQTGMLVGAAVTGLCWGLPVLGIPTSPIEPASMLLLFVLAGVTAFSGISMAAVPMVAVAFLLPALLPVSFWLFSFGERLTFFMGAMTLGYLVLMLLFSRQSHQTIRNLLSITEQNKELAAALAHIKALEGDALRQENEQRMTEALIAREQEFRSLAESSPDKIARYDRNGYHRYLNATLVKLLSLSSMEEALGKRPREMWPDGRYDKLEQANMQVVESGVAITLELREPDGAGGEYVHLISVIPERDAAGKIIGTIVFGRDITERKRMEDELAARERDFRSLAENSPDNIARWDLEGRYLYINSAHEKTLGVSANKIVGKAIPDTHAHVKAAIAKVVATGLADVLVRQPILVDGETKIHEVSLAPERDADGRIVSVLGIGRDMTVTYRMQETIAAREQEFRSLAESSPDFIIRYDREGRVRYLNTVLLGMLGLSGDAEAIGKLPSEMWPDGRFNAIEQTAARVVESGVVETVEQQLPNGEVHHIRIAPERDAAGLIVGSIVFGRDITERKRAEIELQDSFRQISELNVHLEQNARDLEEQAVELEISKEQLQQTEAWYRSILQSAPDGMLVVDERGRIIQVNAQLEAMFGYECGELAGCHIEVLLPKAAIQNNPFGRHSDASQDLLGCRKDGSKFPVDMSLSRLPDLDGRTGAICAAVRDVTEQRAMEAAREGALAEALHLAQLRSTFMAQMSHELRTPLNGILGYAQNLLLQGESLGEKQVTGLRIIQNSGEHLLSLINGILDHAAIEAGKFELVPGKIELEPFLVAIIGIIRVKAEQKNISFTCDAGENLPAVVSGDAQRLRQVLLNLLSNAVKFTDSGYVILRVSHIAPYRIRFEVQDSGVGIAADQLENIFLPFEQAGEIGRRAGGNGLGLAISRKLVKLMGGDIRVESQPGAGSTFSFEIDMETVQSGAAKVDAATLAQQAATHVAQATPMLTIPPKQELDALYDMALRGSMRDVMRHADRLAEADERYLPFAGQLRQLAKSFQTKALLGLIDQYRNEKELEQ